MDGRRGCDMKKLSLVHNDALNWDCRRDGFHAGIGKPGYIWEMAMKHLSVR